LIGAAAGPRLHSAVAAQVCIRLRFALALNAPIPTPIQRLQRRSASAFASHWLCDGIMARAVARDPGRD
jgi:hypothetical protein